MSRDRDAFDQAVGAYKDFWDAHPYDPARDAETCLSREAEAKHDQIMGQVMATCPPEVDEDTLDRYLESLFDDEQGG